MTAIELAVAGPRRMARLDAEDRGADYRCSACGVLIEGGEDRAIHRALRRLGPNTCRKLAAVGPNQRQRRRVRGRHLPRRAQ